jgi:hypothetical protein
MALRSTPICGGVYARAVSRSGRSEAQADIATVGAAVGILAPTLLAVVFVVLSIVERGFLHEVGWSAIRRTDVEWPSLLERGPQGWVLQVAFVVVGALGLIFSASLWAGATARIKVAAAGLAALSAAVACMAFPPDLPNSSVHSWQDGVHNGIYPVIPAGALVAALALAAGRTAVDNRQSVASRLFLAVALSALGLTFIAAIAQLVRFVFFAALLAWIGYLAWAERPSTW